MTHQITCKICRLPLTVQSDDDYCGDVLKLLPMVCHNRCYDLRTRRERIREFILAKACQLTRDKLSGESRGAIRQGLGIALVKYAQLIAEYHQAGNPLPHLHLVDYQVDLLVQNPGRSMKLLDAFGATVRGLIRGQRTPVPAEA